MDILSQYKKENAEVPHPVAGSPSPPDHGLLVRIVIRCSGGRIRNEIQASYALLTVALLVATVSFVLFFMNSSSEFSEDWTPYQGMSR